MPASSKPPPEFDRSFLVELAGAAVYASAKRLFESRAVRSAEWESPLLLARVAAGGRDFRPCLNLRSTVFVENECGCEDGRKGKICAHAVAGCLYFQEQLSRGTESAPSGGSADKVTPEAEKPKVLRSIRIDPERGGPLKVLLFLPPNLEQAAERDAIMVKLDAAAGREVLPLGRLSPTQPYAPTEAHHAALLQIESWCGGKLGSLVQLSRVQLHELLAILAGEPVVYWVKRPGEPIAWERDELAGVHSVLGEALSGAAESVVAREPEPRERPAAKPNTRREAEAGAFGNWKTGAGDYPVARAVAASASDFDENAIVVDGSPNFLAIRLPSEQPEVIKPLRDLLKSEGFTLEPRNRRWWLRDRHKTLNFLAAHWGRLRDEWRAAFTENFSEKFKGVGVSELAIEAKEEHGRFAVAISLSNGTGEQELRQALASGRNYVESDGGGMVLLDRSTLERLHRVEKTLSGQADRPFTPTFNCRLESVDLASAEDVLEELCEGWHPPQAWQSRSRALREVGALEPAPVRKEFDARLRSYQRIGVAWLWHLYRNQLGGILADEMGLGKTLQALALIECVRARKSGLGPALVVAPASLVENWAREAARFAPHLAVVRHHGPGRAKEPVVLEDADLVITSYGTLRQDAGMLATMDWSVVIGDEAQHIKNRRTQNARSLAQLHTEGRFLLTGTPVENSLEDLISLFAFLMPGFLGKAPATATTEDRQWHQARQVQRAAPYILRRTKKEVAPELPEKIEKTLFCELGAKQTRFYKEVLEKTRRELFQLEMGGAHEGRLRMAALTELLRLRQACVDPRILDEDFAAAESSKLGAFEEILDECIDAGSRMLVFSSFVTALKLLAQDLEARGHRFCYLDGQTKDRLAVCDQFNGDPDIPVFLISLKAGGTGLNLTGADTVVHYDPWWNPAAEAQATDRAHRIGQTRTVTSIRLIAANTVEEKVLELQRRKADILRELFDESAAANAKVSLDEMKELLA